LAIDLESEKEDRDRKEERSHENTFLICMYGFSPNFLIPFEHLVSLVCLLALDGLVHSFFILRLPSFFQREDQSD